MVLRIGVFDSLSKIPNVRLRLPEFEFDISIPDKMIAQINIDNLMPSFKDSKELVLCH